MTEHDLAALISRYREGLEAEIVILRLLEQAAARQHMASARHDLDAMNSAADERDRLMAGLVNVEEGVRDLRRTLSADRERARRLPGYPEAVALHQQAAALVATILSSDEASLRALSAADMARRETMRALERGETILTAYRRVMALPPGATLVNRRG